MQLVRVRVRVQWFQVEVCRRYRHTRAGDRWIVVARVGVGAVEGVAGERQAEW